MQTFEERMGPQYAIERNQKFYINKLIIDTKIPSDTCIIVCKTHSVI